MTKEKEPYGANQHMNKAYEMFKKGGGKTAFDKLYVLICRMRDEERGVPYCREQ